MNTNRSGVNSTSTNNTAAAHEGTGEGMERELAEEARRHAAANNWWAGLSAIEKEFLRRVGSMVGEVGIKDNGQVVEVSAGTLKGGTRRFLRTQRMTEWGKNGRRLKRRRSEESMETSWAALVPGSPRAGFGRTTGEVMN